MRKTTIEYPLWDQYKLCPSARYVGGTSNYLCECADPKKCAGANAAMRRYAEDLELKHPGAHSYDPHNILLSVTNDGKIYTDYFRPVIEKLADLYATGRYNAGLAVGVWQNTVSAIGYAGRARVMAPELAHKYAESVAFAAYFGEL